MTGSRVAAFFDVDETLLARSGLWDFLAFQLAERHGPELSGPRLSGLRAELRHRAAAGESRDELCRLIYCTLAGAAVALTRDQGRRWFSAADDGTLFHPPVRQLLEEHTARGELVVLVSASFAACLDPIADQVGAEVVLCSEPTIEVDHYTGDLYRPMVGAAKAEAIRGLAAVAGIDLDRSWAYGDHSSDLPMLHCVGHPVVVGDDPVLTSRVGPRGRSVPRVVSAAS
jgi:HAD superfamily hydrolase (TIGR01490 family)